MKTKIELITKKMKAVVTQLTPSGYKMGDKFTLIVKLPNGDLLREEHDERQYYSGRGSKYNSSIRHGDIVEHMSINALNKAYKPILERQRELKKREIANKLYLKNCNSPEFLRKMLCEKIDIISEKPAPEGDGRYYINGYHGCGVYRLAVKEGKILATIHGGFHNSKPYGTEDDVWLNSIKSFLNEKIGEGYKLIKADGSGTYFYVRYSEDACLLNVKEYDVPSAYGGVHHNIEVAV
jgi:hypothetical protein